MHRDIQKLIASAKTEFLTDMNNKVLQDKLKALVDLQSILATHQLPPHELEAIRQKVAELSTPPVSTTYPQPSIVTPVPYANGLNITSSQVSQNYPQLHVPPATVHHTVTPSTQQQHQPDLSMMNSSRLADILASAKAQQAPPTPVVAPTPASYNQPPVVPIPTTTAGGAPSSLLAQLRAAGLLAPEGNTPVNGPVAPHPQYPPPQPAGHAPTTPLVSLANPMKLAFDNDVELTSASLKK